MMILFESWSMMMVLITMLLIRIWWCCWSKDQSAEDVADKNAEDIVADRKVKTLKMLLIERSKCWRCCFRLKGQRAKDVVVDRKVKVLKMLLIERSMCWRCFWSKGQSAEDVVADWKIKTLKMLLIEEVKELMMMKTEDWRWRLHDVQKLPMIYRCVTLLMLMMSPISTLAVVDVSVEYPSR